MSELTKRLRGPIPADVPGIVAERAEAADRIEALEEIEQRVRRENDTLRGLLGNSAKPCPYCGLAAEDQAKCASGFPGCARADDQMLSKHFADAYRAERAEAELAECRKKCERLKLHAEAMDAATISHVDGRDLLAELHLNRAHYCDIRVRINGEYRTHEGDWLKNLQRERNAYRADFPKE